MRVILGLHWDNGKGNGSYYSIAEVWCLRSLRTSLNVGHSVLLQDLGISQIMDTFLGVPIVRTIVYWGLYWGPPVLGNYHLKHTHIRTASLWP